MMRKALRSCRLYSWMRLTWLSKMVSGSTVCPEVDRSHSAKAALAARLAARTPLRRSLSSASDLSLASWTRSVIHQAGARDAALFAGEAVSHRIEQPAVDLEDDLEVAWQQDLEPLERPLLERLGQQRVVRVRQRPVRQVPGLVPSQVRLVEQDPHQLGDGEGRVRVVELDGDLLGKRAPVGVAPTESPDQIGQ